MLSPWKGWRDDLAQRPGEALLGFRIAEAHWLLPDLGRRHDRSSHALGGTLDAMLPRARGMDPTGTASPISGIRVAFAIILGHGRRAAGCDNRPHPGAQGCDN